MEGGRLEGGGGGKREAGQETVGEGGGGRELAWASESQGKVAAACARETMIAGGSPGQLTSSPALTY